MKRPWLAYLLVALAACGAGVAIAGLPGGGSTELLVPQTLPSTSTSTTSSPSTTGTPTTSAATSTTAPPTTESTSTTTTTPSTTSAPATTTTTTPPTTTTTTTAPATTTSTAPDPTDASVAVANGAGVPGAAGDAAELLIEAGFADVAAINADPVDVTTVYYAEGFEATAGLVAAELFIDPDAIAPMSEVPELDTDEEFDAVAVLGADIGS